MINWPDLVQSILESDVGLFLVSAPCFTDLMREDCEYTARCTLLAVCVTWVDLTRLVIVCLFSDSVPEDAAPRVASETT